ncbi:MAG: AMP-binding protein, partial [Ignavibacteria bacterium]|nr:AMP-binding protein [Ignavibacteria bacterium]
LIQWMDTFPDKEYYNAYGPTEATGVSMIYKVEYKPRNTSDSIPIGKACKNTEVFLLKEDRTLARTGEKGEICIRGSRLSNGYWNDNEKTNKAFIINPLTNILGDKIYKTGDIGRILNNGNIEFIGRKDTQVKYMGYRIELPEIENAILNIQGVDEVAVILSESNIISIPELVAFFTAKKEITSDEIISKLNNILSPYMVPKRIIYMDELPRTDRGKIDRVGLKHFFSN